MKVTPFQNHWRISTHNGRNMQEFEIFFIITIFYHINHGKVIYNNIFVFLDLILSVNSTIFQNILLWFMNFQD